MTAIYSSVISNIFMYAVLTLGYNLGSLCGYNELCYIVW